MSVRPDWLAFDPLSIAGATLDHAVGPVLDAEEVQRCIGVVAPGPCRQRPQAQYRAFGRVDAFAIYQELPATTHDGITLAVFLMPMQERHRLRGRNDVERSLQPRRSEEALKEQLALCRQRHVGWFQPELRPVRHRAGVESSEVGAAY